MSIISRLSPYAYLAKRSGNNTIYDLLILIPVDSTGDTDLSNVSPVKPGGTRIRISYTTTGTSANAPYRFKHWEIDTDGTYLDLEIKGDNNADKTLVLAFADADTEQATVSNQIQTCAPYLFAKIETVGSIKYIQPSCIVLFDNGLGAQGEAITFASNSCSLTFTLGTSGATTSPGSFTINQNVKAQLSQGVTYSFEGNVAANGGANKPPRKKIVAITY